MVVNNPFFLLFVLLLSVSSSSNGFDITQTKYANPEFSTGDDIKIFCKEKYDRAMAFLEFGSLDAALNSPKLLESMKSIANEILDRMMTLLVAISVNSGLDEDEKSAQKCKTDDLLNSDGFHLNDLPTNARAIIAKYRNCGNRILNNVSHTIFTEAAFSKANAHVNGIVLQEDLKTVFKSGNIREKMTVFFNLLRAFGSPLYDQSVPPRLDRDGRVLMEGFLKKNQIQELRRIFDGANIAVHDQPNWRFALAESTKRNGFTNPGSFAALVNPPILRELRKDANTTGFRCNLIEKIRVCHGGNCLKWPLIPYSLREISVHSKSNSDNMNLGRCESLGLTSNERTLAEKEFGAARWVPSTFSWCTSTEEAQHGKACRYLKMIRNFRFPQAASISGTTDRLLSAFNVLFPKVSENLAEDVRMLIYVYISETRNHSAIEVVFGAKNQLPLKHPFPLTPDFYKFLHSSSEYQENLTQFLKTHLPNFKFPSAYCMGRQSGCACETADHCESSCNE